MKIRQISLLALQCACVLSLSTLAFADSAGTAAFSFLNIPVGARATAMGQAFTSVTNDVQGLAYNPASLATLVSHQASFQHLSYVEDINQEAVAYGHAGRQEGLSWGFFANYFKVGKITRTEATLDTTGEGYVERGDFSTYDLATGVSAAAPVGEDLVLGATVKLIRESLADASANAGAFDLGVIYQANEERAWNIGGAIQNVGFASKFADETVKLPIGARVGVSGQPFAQWLFSMDYSKRQDTKGEIDVGTEVTPKKFFALRLGYRYAFNRPDLGGLADFSAGFGIRQKKISFDYAFIPLGDLGMTHRISLNLRFKSR
jgi:long-subunit fatty acid transport protein